MNAIATNLHARALQADAEHDPHFLHGLLLMLERDVSFPVMARLVGMPASRLKRCAIDARAGLAGRARIGSGIDSAPEAARPSPAGRELFKTPWRRVAIELMARPSGALTGELNIVLCDFDMLQSGKLLQSLRKGLCAEGFEVSIEPDAKGRQSRYFFAEDVRERVISLMANGWVAA